jgi:hypothetical protein
MARYSEEETKALASQIIDGEYVVGQSNNNIPDADYLDYLDMFDCERTEKNYDWMSDIYMPEFLSQMLTQSAIEAGLYFKTHDFVEVYVGNDDEVSIRAAKVNKDLINHALNRRDLWFYQKYMRAVNMKNICGVAYFRCWWEQETKQEKVGSREVPERVGSDPEGNSVERMVEEDVEMEIILKDQFNFDVVDPRDVFTDTSYAYSLQEKKWVILRFNATIDELEANADTMEYFNLDKLEDTMTPPKVGAKGDKTTHHGLDNKTEAPTTPLKNWTILQRLGKHWVMVKERDEKGNVVDVRCGIDTNGKKKKGAELHEMVITFAVNDYNRVLIGYNPSRCIDSKGNPYRPITRALCYIHPAKDDGMGDGKCLKELQVGINDTINMENDRTKLHTIPIMQGNQHDITDNESLEWKPGAFWQTESGNVLTEVQVGGDVNGALQQIVMYKNAMQQASGISAETQSKLAAPTTTATATANQMQRSDTRSNYRTLTMENTALSDLYWFITQMTAQHMKQATAMELLAQDARFFNPYLDYTYKPLSASLNDDASRQAKVQNWISILGYVANDPERRAAVDYILGEVASLMGKEYEGFHSKFFADTQAPPPVEGGGGQQPQGGGVQQPQGGGGTPPTNQSGVEQTMQEAQLAEGMGA